MSNITSWSWSHSLKNYLLMFDLTTEEFAHTILEVAAGASSFNIEMKRQGYHVISSDPLYNTKPSDITPIVTDMVRHLVADVEKHLDRYHWSEECVDLDDLKRQQQAMADIFLNDYVTGLDERRYIATQLPSLDFKNFEFGLALCANFLFDSSADSSLEFQLSSIKEMCRVAKEARIFPLLDSAGHISAHLGPIMAELQSQGYGVEVRQVPYNLLKNGNAMLRVFARDCLL